MANEEKPKQLHDDMERVACVIHVLSHLMDSLHGQDSSYLFEIDSASGYVSSTCSFSVESMHVCCNRKCTELGERLLFSCFFCVLFQLPPSMVCRATSEIIGLG
jgi:hypothetical protein